MSLIQPGSVVIQGRLEEREPLILPGYKKDENQTERFMLLLDERRDRQCEPVSRSSEVPPPEFLDSPL
jgi:hypothetical protein